MRPSLTIIITLFLVTRLVNLTLLPIFQDEANYLDWGWRETHNGVPFHSLYDAKPPLLMWIQGLAQSLPLDPLLAGRLVSVVFGLLTLLGLSKLSPLAPILYTLSPIFFFYDRQALMEGPLCTIAVWTYLYLRRLLSAPTIKNAIILGTILGVGFFIKPTALILLFSSLAIITIYSLLQKSRFFLLQTLALVILSAFLLIVSPLLFQSKFWSTLHLNTRYAFTLSEIIHTPFVHWASLTRDNFEIAAIFITPLVFAVSLLNLRKLASHLQLFIVIPFLIFSFSARSTNFRYLTPFLPLFLIPAANFFSKHSKLLLVSLLPGLFLIILLLFNPPTYFHTLSRLTHFSYIDGHLTGSSTGYQTMQTIKYLRSLTQKKIVIGLAVNAGNPEAAILTYFKKDPLVITSYIDKILYPNILDYDCISSSLPFYFVARQNQQAGLEKFFIPVTEIRNPYNSDFHTIYTLKSPCSGKTLSI